MKAAYEKFFVALKLISVYFIPILIVSYITVKSCTYMATSTAYTNHILIIS